MAHIVVKASSHEELNRMLLKLNEALTHEDAMGRVPVKDTVIEVQ